MTDVAAAPVMALVSGIGDYQTQVISGITRRLVEHGIPLLVVSLDSLDSSITPDVVLDLVRSGGVQGVIGLADPAVLRRSDLTRVLASAGLPVVTLGMKFLQFPCVRGENLAGMRALMGHLLDERGVRRPVLVRGVADHPDSQLREQVFREECARRGIDVDEDLIVDSQFCSKPAYDAVRGLLARRRDFDAIVALNDPSAFGALSALTDHGLNVPEDVLLTGFDNIRESAISWPLLSTVDQRLEEQGERAAALLLELLAGNQLVDDVEFPSRFLARASTSGAVVPEQVLSSARALQGRLTMQELAVQISWYMANCRTIDEVATALDPCLTQLGIRRCFLALDEPDLTTDGGSVRRSRLAISYQDGRMGDACDEVFPRHQMLPTALRGELHGGSLLLQPLSIEGRERGYLLYDLNTENHVLTEALRIELNRTIDMVFSSRELKDHATVMELLVTRRTRELERANAELQRSVMRDGLTGIANRRAFEAFLEQMCTTGEAGSPSVGLLMVDVDLFKAFNDRYGHLAGDDALMTVASCLARSVRTSHDLACRYGGEEFAVILPGADIDGAVAVAERFGRLLADARIEHGASPVAPTVTASIGVAATAGGGECDRADLVAAADQALYRAKDQGRNRIVAAEAVSGQAIRTTLTWRP